MIEAINNQKCTFVANETWALSQKKPRYDDSSAYDISWLSWSSHNLNSGRRSFRPISSSISPYSCIIRLRARHDNAGAYVLHQTPNPAMWASWENKRVPEDEIDSHRNRLVDSSFSPSIKMSWRGEWERNWLEANGAVAPVSAVLVRPCSTLHPIYPLFNLKMNS